MSEWTRLEMGIAVVPGQTLFRVTYPTGGVDYDVSLSRAFYPHRHAFFEAVNAFLGDAGVPVRMFEDYSTTLIGLDTAALNFDFAISLDGQVAGWLGADSASENNVALVTFGQSEAALQLAAPFFDESYEIRLSRVANFADDGRMRARLVNRYVAWRCTLFVDNVEAAEWRAFARWLAQGRKAIVHRAWDDQGAPGTNYVMAPLHGAEGFKWLQLDGDAGDALDAPAQEPDVHGQHVEIEGIVYGV